MLQYGKERYPEFYPIIQRHFAYHKDFLVHKMQEWNKESPTTVGPLIPQIHAALTSLPPLQPKSSNRKKHTAATTRPKIAPAAHPEMISLLGDDDDDDTEKTKSLKDDRKRPAQKAPPPKNATILLLDD
jgi:hypothetical protein